MAYPGDACAVAPKKSGHNARRHVRSELLADQRDFLRGSALDHWSGSSAVWSDDQAPANVSRTWHSCEVETFRLEAADDHVRNLAHENDVVRAVSELVWNALDADATRISVELIRNSTEGIDGVAVSDNGHGMSAEAASAGFRNIGGSWKRVTRRSPGDRPLHGKFGRGRLRAFALGTDVVWETVGTGVTGETVSLVITVEAGTVDKWTVSTPVPSQGPTGTTFRSAGKQGLDRLASDEAHALLLAEFAPYLMDRPVIEVTYDGAVLRPSDNVKDDTVVQLRWEHGNQELFAELRIIEWRKAARSSVVLADENAVVVESLDRAPAPDFRYSAYILWERMPEFEGQWMLAGVGQDSELAGLLETSNQAIMDHFEGRRNARRREQVDKWKATGSYPYLGEPSTDEETVERATFDVLATAIGRHIPTGRRQQKLTLGLLKESLQQQPERVGDLIDQWIGLPEQERQDFDRLLKQTGLSRLIQANTNVSNRLEFLRALELMVFDPETVDMVGERDHLHRILERELWVFGEQFNMMASERGLSFVLERHIELLGAEVETKPVRRLDGRIGRVDLLLSAKAREYERARHLVIELKAPKITATMKEVEQIKSYARTVAADPQFAGADTLWDFWLITSDIDQDVQEERSQANRERGIVYASDGTPDQPRRVRVWVKTWSEIVNEAQQRLAFYQDTLRRDVTLEEAREYLVRNHGDVIPEGLIRTVHENGSKEGWLGTVRTEDPA